MMFQTNKGIFLGITRRAAAQEIYKISLENSRPGIVPDPIDLKDIGCSRIIQEEKWPSFVYSFPCSSSSQAESNTEIHSDFEVARTEEAQNEARKQSETMSSDNSRRSTSLQAGVDGEIGFNYESKDDDSWEEKGEGETYWHKAFSSSSDGDKYGCNTGIYI
jgi:hypothetical protein